MRLKKVFVGALAAAMLVCAVAVPAFAAEEVEQENGLSSSYVQMNIPYADFYKAAGVDNASEIDAVQTCRRFLPRQRRRQRHYGQAAGQGIHHHLYRRGWRCEFVEKRLI